MKTGVCLRSQSGKAVRISSILLYGLAGAYLHLFQLSVDELGYLLGDVGRGVLQGMFQQFEAVGSRHLDVGQRQIIIFAPHLGREIGITGEEE